MTSNLKASRAVVFTFGIFLSCIAFAQPKLLVVGSMHFANPGRDEVNIEVADIMTDRRQREIKELVAALAEFRPTHIAVEYPSKYQDRLDEMYTAYQAGEYELRRNEADQVGLRLAAELGHEKVYAVDWNENPPGNIDTDYDWYTYGMENGHATRIEAITDPERAGIPEMNEQSVSEWFLQLNTAESLQKAHEVYFDIAMIGDGENLIGANWVGTWYARNLKIFSRLVDLAEDENARILVLYGRGHAYLLRQFAVESGRFELVDLEEVLTGASAR